jgi:hypothetical protein
MTKPSASAGPPKTDVPRLMNEAYTVRVLDALHDTATVAVRPHDGLHLL